MFALALLRLRPEELGNVVAETLGGTGGGPGDSSSRLTLFFEVRLSLRSMHALRRPLQRGKDRGNIGVAPVLHPVMASPFPAAIPA
jgi:hypothetical protein